MKPRHLIMAGCLLVLVIAGAMGWYLIAPPFIDTMDAESFPLEVPSQTALAQMPATGPPEIEAAFLAAIPGETAMGNTTGR